MMSDKIKPQHLVRKAILYVVRQSSAHQVHHNLESQRLQYAMQDRLQQLGWRETLRLAVERGEIEAEHPFADGPWARHVAFRYLYGGRAY
jgi:hypothetical protein